MPAVDLNPLELSPEDRQVLEKWGDLLTKSWSDGQLAQLYPSLPPKGNPLRLHLLVRLIQTDMTFRCQRGRHGRVEEYLKKYPELLSVASVPVDLMWLEVQLHEKYGIPSSNPSLPIPPKLRAAPDAGTANEAVTAPSQPPVLPKIPSELPEEFGRYRILSKLGAGNLGAVYLAHDTHLERRVALKVPQFKEEDGPDALLRFWREAKSAAKLQHPYICQVHDVGVFDGIPFLTMTYVEGQTLAKCLDPDHPLAVRQAVDIAHKLAQGLGYAHSQKIIHRDLKPGNVLLNPQGDPVVMDFGLAKRMDKASTVIKTNPGTFMGTLAYMPPEQLEGDVKAVGPGCDIYSLGALLYELLTGRTPFRGAYGQVMVQILSQPPEPPSAHRPDVPAALDAVCLKALAKKPVDRFASMEEFAQALEACRAELGDDVQEEQAASSQAVGQGPGRRWMIPAVVAAALLTGLAVGALVYNRSRPTGNGDQQAPTPAPASPVEELARLTGHADWITGVALSADGSQVVSSSLDGTVRLWAVDGGKQQKVFHHPAGWLYCVALSPDGHSVAAGGSDGTILVWDLRSDAKPRELQGHTDAVRSVAVSSDGRLLLSGSDDGTIKLWDGSEARELRTFKGHSGGVRAALTPKGDKVFSGSWDGTIRLWNAADGRELAQLEVGQGTVWAVAISPDGRVAIRGNGSKGAGTIHVWDLQERKRTNAWNAHNPAVFALAYSPDDRLILSGGEDGTAKFWDAAKGELLETVTAHQAPVQAVAFARSAPVAVTGGRDGTVCAWRLRFSPSAGPGG